MPVVRPLGEEPGDGGIAAPDQPREPLRAPAPVRPLTDGTVRPTASATPLRFRATPRPVEVFVAADPAPRALQQAVITRPPAELAQALRSSHGVDVADVEVRRDSAVATEASARRARAFTRGATVHLPESAGPLTAPQVRGLLAHELVHAAQQRRFGSSLPAEHTPEGAPSTPRRSPPSARTAGPHRPSPRTSHCGTPRSRRPPRGWRTG